MPLVVHHLDQSRSHRVLWLLEELEADYAIREWKRDRKTMRAPKGLRDVHPLGKAPVVELSDGRVVAESAVILETLVDLHDGALRPQAGTEAAQRYRYFMHYAEGSLMPPLLVKLITGQIAKAPVPFFVKPIPKAIAKKVDEQFTNGEITRNLSFLDDELRANRYFCGEEFSAADVQMSFPVAAALSRGGVADRYANVQRWLQEMRTRPAWSKAEDRGGALDLSAF